MGSPGLGRDRDRSVKADSNIGGATMPAASKREAPEDLVLGAGGMVSSWT